MGYYTEKDAIITATLGPAGNQIQWPSDMTSWKTYEGGEPVAQTSQLLPGGNIKAKAMPGPVTYTNVTITAPYTTEISNKRANINSMCNRAMSVTFTPKDADGNANGTPQTLGGILKQPQWPKGDSSSGNPMMFGLVMECDAQ